MPSQCPASPEAPPTVPAFDAGFDAWFSGSLAVNPDGTPLVVYHGTAHVISAFKPAQAHDGIYFTDNAETADEYAEIAIRDGESIGAVVYPVHLSIRRPLEISNDDLMFTEETQELLEATIAQARREGRDGVILRAVDDHGACCSSDMYVVFDSSQVRSALGHRAVFAADVAPEPAAIPAAEAAEVDRSLPIRGLTLKNATVRLGDLPRDMREELFNEHATNLDPEATERAFYAKRVPSGTIAIADLVIDRIPAEQLERYTDPGQLPPIVIADGRLIDGQHRIARGRADGVERLRFIDVTGLIDTDVGGFVSELPREPRVIASANPSFTPLTENGQPLTLFHGSPHAFDAFNAGEHGIFFAKRRDAAVAYAEGWDGAEGSGHVIAAQISMHNPAVVDRAFLARFEARYPDDVAKAAKAPRSSLSFSDAFEDSESWARNVVVEQLRRAGHDGMVLPNDLLPVNCMGGDWELQPAYAVFSPEQIRRVPDPELAVTQSNKALAFVASLQSKGPRP